MKHLLSRLAAIATVAAVAQTSFAAVVTCGEFQLGVPNTNVSCPSAGTSNQIKSSIRVTNFAGQTLWTYSINMIQGPRPEASPRAAAALITNAGALALNINGIQCPESVDITVGDGAPSAKNCQTRGGGDAGNPRKVRVFHATI
jgi:hypothetical protein